MKKILVTGGAGFVGSNLCRMLTKEHNCVVTVLDDFFTGRKEFLKGLDVEIIEGSVLDVDLIKKVVKNKTHIFHLAARNIIASMKDPGADLEANIKGTFNLLQAALKSDIEKLVYTSTTSIYGNSRFLPVYEELPPQFLNFYSVSKYSGEAYVNVFFEQYNLPTTIVRYSNVYGVNQSPKNPYCGVIGKFIEAALANKKLMIHGDGEQTRDYTFVEDACNATIAAAFDPKAIGETFNIGTGVEISVNTLAKKILEITNSKSVVEHIDKRDIDNIRRRVLNVEKIRYKLRFFPQYNLHKGLEKTVEWYITGDK